MAVHSKLWVRPLLRRFDPNVTRREGRIGLLDTKRTNRLTIWFRCCSRQAPEPKLLPQEEVTYAEPVLVPQPPKLHSPKGTMRKPPPTPTETLFQFPDGYGFRGPRDNFGTLRSHQGDAYRRNDGFATTRSVKKVYL